MTDTKSKFRGIPAPLRQHINRMAHEHGLNAESRLRAELFAKVQAALATGATTQDLLALVGGAT